ncbi:MULTISPECIES: SURF1 family protein [unclassified Rhizobium]|uniref:SURF1 family protein n=1 Tax=unclassified Rhizobium TaxID=2613769 RepID=UPI00161E8616|nr:MULTISPECIES: SURF1 family protein [unclassified Rhizobium]MBB3393392.1 surfeit locus 1 family protein [Rhizobium sp. BK060]MBB4170513.1 surfeit locus 1 family protein [Rhizobium sp. BK538]
MADIPSEKAQRQHTAAGLTIFCGLMVLLIAALLSLGIWQVERLSWKEDLIARVDQRVHAKPVPAPARAQWGEVSRANDEYRHVTAEGILQNDKETLIYASTALGPGYWVITPLNLSNGTSILINRGFVPTDKRDAATRRDGQVPSVKITGLLRITEPKGTLIKSNDPANDRWYSRDVAAIADRRNVADVAPYFIDADATPNPGGLPVGGLTQITFPNNHLVYAITWLALAIMASGLLAFVVRSELRARRADQTALLRG